MQKFIVEVDEYWPDLQSESTCGEWASWPLPYKEAKGLYYSILSGFDEMGDSWFNSNKFEADCYFSKRSIRLPVVVRIRADLPWKIYRNVKKPGFSVVEKTVINTDRHEMLGAMI